MNDLPHTSPKPSTPEGRDGRPWPATTVDRLSGGLRVVVCHLPHLHTASVGLFVRCGSRFESPMDHGLSHLVEHVLFRGCADYPDSLSFNSAFESCSLGLEGLTARDLNAYDTTCSPGEVAGVLELLGAMLRAPLFTKVELERQIILEELQDEVDERGRAIDLDNVAKAALLAGSPMAQSVGGSPERLARFGQADCARWFARHYTARNMVLAVGGPLPAAEVVKLAEQALGDLPEGQMVVPAPPTVRPDLPAFEYVSCPSSQTCFQLTWPLPGCEHPDWPALHTLHRLLDDGSCARLRHDIVDQLGLAYDVAAEFECYEGLSLLSVEATVTHGNVAKVLDRSLAVVADLASSPPGDDEWKRVRSRQAFEMASLVDLPSVAMSFSGQAELNAPHTSVAERQERLGAVTPEDLAAAVRGHLVGQPMQLTVVGDLPGPDRAALRRRLHSWCRTQSAT